MLEQTILLYTRQCTLSAAPAGSLLLYDGRLLFKSARRSVTGAPEVFEVSTGEPFWLRDRTIVTVPQVVQVVA